jgi:hypothetical protein
MPPVSVLSQIDQVHAHPSQFYYFSFKQYHAYCFIGDVSEDRADYLCDGPLFFDYSQTPAIAL